VLFGVAGLGVALATLLMMLASTPPTTAHSNLSEWAKAWGLHHILSWLETARAKEQVRKWTPKVWLVCVFVAILSGSVWYWQPGAPAVVSPLGSSAATTMTPSKAPSYTGVIEPKLLFNPKWDGDIHKIEIGTSGVFLSKERGHYSWEDLFRGFLDDSQLKVEMINGKIMFSTKITDQSGNLVAELIRNEWKVDPSRSWDRNYSDDAIEVKDPAGWTVLQVRVFKDVMQIQGGWWAKFPKPSGPMYQMFVLKDPMSDRAMIKFFSPETGCCFPDIVPIFKYPGALHLGEMVNN
jgi:hypothetical protein